MSSPRHTSPGAPVHLGLPEPDPEPVPGCDSCVALRAAREQARTDGDLAAVSDANVLMRRHHGKG